MRKRQMSDLVSYDPEAMKDATKALSKLIRKRQAVKGYDVSKPDGYVETLLFLQARIKHYALKDIHDWIDLKTM